MCDNLVKTRTPTIFGHVLIGEEEGHVLVLHAQLVVEDLEVLPERLLVVATAEGNAEHLTACRVGRQLAQRLFARPNRQQAPGTGSKTCS